MKYQQILHSITVDSTVDGFSRVIIHQIRGFNYTLNRHYNNIIFQKPLVTIQTHHFYKHPSGSWFPGGW